MFRGNSYGHGFVCHLVGYISEKKKLFKTAILSVQELRIQKKLLVFGPTLAHILTIFRERKKSKLYILEKVAVSAFKGIL